MRCMFRYLWFLLLCVAVFVFTPVFAEDITPSYLYKPTPSLELPQILYVGFTQKCGDFTIRLLQQPVVAKSNNFMVADADFEYLMIRVAITNETEEVKGWLDPESFHVQDVYLGRIFGTYDLDVPITAKAAQGFKQQAFFEPIKPHETLYTTLVFLVYPDVSSWIFIFAPRTFGEKPSDEIRFQIPKAYYYQEGPDEM